MAGVEGPPGALPPPGQRQAVLVVVSLSAFLTPFLSSALNLAIPAIGEEFAAPAAALHGVVVAFIIAAAALLLPFGRLADLAGRRRIFLTGAALQALFLLAAAAAPNISSLVWLRALQGGTGAMPFATGMAMVVAAFPASQRGRVLGISVASVYLGLALGPVIGGLIVEWFGWRAIFLGSGLFGGGMALYGALSIPHEQLPVSADRRFDWFGAALYAAGFGALVGGLAAVARSGAGKWVIAAGAVAFGLFLVRDRLSARPIVPARLFRDPVFTFSNLAALLNYSATFAVGYLLSLYLQVVRGLPPRHAGLLLLAQPLTMALLSPLAGRLSDRFQPRVPASLGMALTALSLFLFALLGPATPLAVVVGTLLLIGVGFALFSSPNTNAVMSAVDRRDYSVASAVLGTMRQLGQSLSMAALALLTARTMGEAQLGADNALALLATQRQAFLLFGPLCVLGVLASLARGRVRRGEPLA
ncbi:MAG: MFS transporter [Acidobacteriota bacterium]|nr:MFS transporter [Acidobacteriota bacterium]